ncbi:hypothetical protein [Aliikangiella sp. G2MR2-5]|uniref:HD domain-containing protein n=1 Tax=Aliikangiella sp. G2MR2-5 TaxID=2788943 RepID=UPI0018AC3CC5|nr:hypothetical protein [Aliikangiella sp. G2MR2-5]
MKELFDRWCELFTNSDSKVVRDEFDNLIKHYSQPSRHYHNIEHIKACLRHLDEVEQTIKRREIEIAFWFHDVIYNPYASDNEEKSAEYAEKALSRLGELEVVDSVKRLILITRHPSKPESLDEQYMIDIDLSILGADAELYSNYESWIREEYRSVPGFLFQRGRKKLLRSFLEMSNIYSTPFFQKKLETAARKNLKNALDNL